MTGEDIPKGFSIDHINRIKGDNRWCNLRLASAVMQVRNRMLPNVNKFRGVAFIEKGNLYIARIRIGGKSTYLGSFKTAEEASAAYEAAYKVVAPSD